MPPSSGPEANEPWLDKIEIARVGVKLKNRPMPPGNFYYAVNHSPEQHPEIESETYVPEARALSAEGQVEEMREAVREVMPLLNMDGERHPKLERLLAPSEDKECGNCENCSGSGLVIEQTFHVSCPTCHGTGFDPWKQEVVREDLEAVRSHLEKD